MSEPDLLQANQDAAMEAIDLAVQQVEHMKATAVNRPAWVTGNKPLPRGVRVSRHRQFLADQTQMEAEWGFLEAKVGIDRNAEAFIPRDFLLYGVAAMKDMKGEEGDEQSAV